jgi:flagellar basal-body rod protein FlgC
VVESQAPVRSVYNPAHPMANDEGYIFQSNVDPIAEMANMMSASRSYQNNVEIANTSKQLLIRTLQMGK